MLAYVLAEDSLPPKPVDPHGRAVLWVYVLGEPGFIYHGREVTVDAASIDQHVNRFRLLAGRGYTPPLAAEHPRAIHDKQTLEDLAGLEPGLRKGDILDVRRHTVGGKQALIAAVAPALPREEVERAVALGQLKYFSPGLGPVETDEGDVLSLVLKELSMVAAPHQKTAPSHILGHEQEVAMSQDTGAETAPVTAAEGEQPEVDRMGKMEAALASLMERIDMMEANLAELKCAPEGDKEEVQMSEQDSRIAALEAELFQSRRESFTARFPVGATIALSEADAELFYTMSRKDAAGVNALLGRAKTAPASLAPVGGEGGAPVSTPETAEDLYEVCLSECNGDKGKANDLYLARRRAQLEG